MAYRTLEITLISAKDLKEVNIFSKMEVYAVASLAGDPRTKQRTPVDKEGGRNPNWNFPLRFTVPADDSSGRLVLHILLRCERALGDRDVGEVHVPIKELLEGAGAGDKPTQFLSYQVRKPSSGKPKGVLNFSYRLGEKIGAAAASAPPPSAYPAEAKSNEPVTAYPVGGPSAAYPPPGASSAYPPPGAAAPYAAPAGYQGYPPPQQAYGYGAPPQQAYGYGAPPQQAGYGYQQPAGYGYGAPPPQMVQQPQKKKNKFGMGLGAGLLGGALGGLLIGDMVSDIGDSGYDGGFDDDGGGGFDF